MMSKEEKKRVFEELKESAIITIVRGVDRDKLIPLLEALYEGGIRFAEITFNQSKPETNVQTAESIAELKAHFAGRMHVGAGTVMTKKNAKLAIDAGADFLISPNTDVKVIRYAASKNVLFLPGAFTPSEIATAYNAGADAVKVFPADALGIPYLKAVMAPLSNVPVFAFGGVNENNVADFLNIGIAGVGVGSALTPKALIAEGRFSEITELAKKYTDAVKHR